LQQILCPFPSLSLVSAVKHNHIKSVNSQGKYLSEDPGSQDEETIYESTVRSPIDLIRPDETENLRQIATQQSEKSRRRSEAGAPDVTTRTIAEDDPALDPQSAEFNLEKWLRIIVADAQGRGLSPPQAGIVFKQLNVSGSGAALQLQDTLGSTLALPFRLPELLRQRHSPSRLILKSFNGLMKSGELLLVLGRPGAGCSTFLKTLCGETHGLDVDPKSVLHYNGTNIF
jgi:ATP-binding cassette subfamily G (WHITE) protein 2 (PDR)